MSVTKKRPFELLEIETEHLKKVQDISVYY